MKTFIYAAATATLFAALPASAQMMGDGGMGMRSCVMNGAFVPCPPAGGMAMGGPGMRQGGMVQGGMAQGGMAMEEPGMERRMTRREMRAQQRMERQQRM